MAKIPDGPFFGMSGSVGGWTFAPQPDGAPTTVKGKNKKSTKPRTAPQVAQSNMIALASDFMKPFTEFVRTGYKLRGKILKLSPYNAMKRQVLKEAIEGTQPDQKVNMAKLLITRGSLPSAAETSATITEHGLAFNWSTELITGLSHHSDQVMMLAVFRGMSFPVARYVVAGAQRFAGTDVLLLDGIKRGNTADVYISFIANDHTAIANSTYLGSFNW